MNEQYPSNAKYFPTGDFADEKIKNEFDDRDIDSLVLALENMRYDGRMRLERRKKDGRLCWVSEHFNITGKYGVRREPLPEKGEHVRRRGRKATGQGWALIAGLPKEESIKRQRACQNFRAY